MSTEHKWRVDVVRNGVAGVVTINHPAKRNAISAAMSAQLVAAIDRLEEDTQVKAIVITGAGGAFCAGGDFGDLLAARAGEPQRLNEIYRGFVRILQCRLPTIAAVNGPAVGAGLNLALACDMRIASAAARFETRFLDISLHPGGGHTWLLTRAVGASSAAQMLLLGTSIDGWEAERMRLVARCVGNDDVVAAAIEMALRTTDIPRGLLMTAKDTLRVAAQPNAGYDNVLLLEYERQVRSLQGMNL